MYGVTVIGMEDRDGPSIEIANDTEQGTDGIAELYKANGEIRIAI